MDNNSEVIQVDIFGLSLSSSISGGGYAIILKELEGERRLPIIIGQFEAQAIAFELEGMHPPRPLTHDLLKNVVEMFGYTVERVTISELRDSTFYAKIKFDALDSEELDARPSDAIALAIKFGAPIYIMSYIMDEIGFIPEYENGKEIKNKFSLEDGIRFPEAKAQPLKYDNIPDKPSLSVKEKKLVELKSELEEAVTNEDYEKAAELRDEIKKLELSNFN